MLKPLLIEIGVEELPAIPFIKELPNIEKKWLDILEQNSLNCDFDFFYTPRRLVIFSEHFLLKQNDKDEEFFGAPLNIAYKDGKPTNAALGFAKKCGVSIDEITTIKKDYKEVLYYKKMITGKQSKELLGLMIEQFIKSLNFGKSMRWGSEQDGFIRPIRWIGCMLGDEYVGFDIFGVSSKYFSYGHRALGYEPFAYQSPKQYFEKMKQNGVILFQDERRCLILEQMNKIEQTYKIDIQKDEDLLQEIVAITEYPKALLGTFDEEFLTLPPEVIITSMKEHQRYFACFKDGKLTNNFIVISNSLCEDNSLIIQGNERVLRARLSDGLFFWNNDLKNGLNEEGLKDIVFLDKLGSVGDKVIREQKIGQYLAKKYIAKLKENCENLSEDELLKLLDKTIGLSKADLLSEMVYEFTELQGLMGYYYAKEAKEHELLCIGLKEQYLPILQDGDLPSTAFSSIVALSNKLDTLLALFSINKIPTGTKDPFALRRAALGLIKIVINQQFSFNIKDDFLSLASNYHDIDMKKLQDFIIERMYSYFDVNPSILKAVLSSGEMDVLKISQKLNALEKIMNTQEVKQSFSTFKRVANIVKDIDISKDLLVDRGLFESSFEDVLHTKFLQISRRDFQNYEEKLDALFGLKSLIDEFFEGVMVNVENQKIRQNRQNLVANIYKEFKSIADIKEITI